MRVVRIEHAGPRFGVLEDDSETISLLSGSPFGADGCTRSGQTTSLSNARLLPPVRPSKILAVGRNYAAHAAEMALPTGAAPSVFLKPPQTLVADGEQVVLPPISLSDHVEHEAELAVIIGRPARRIRAEDAAAYVFGFTCADDVSARDLQRSDPHVTRGKGFDTFCPLGAAIETDVDLGADYEVVGLVNGEERQRGSTSSMLFSIAELLESLSAWTTLQPGDVILTGSPSGTGRLAPGDRVEIRIDGVASLQHGVAAADPSQTALSLMSED